MIKVKILNESSRFIEIFLVDKRTTLQVPHKVFKKRYEIGLYEVVNPEKLKAKL